MLITIRPRISLMDRLWLWND